jgi:hypothetical protein
MNLPRTTRIPVTQFSLGVVFEDAPSGVLSGRAAGCKTIGLLTTHPREQMEAAQPDILIQDLSRLAFVPSCPFAVMFDESLPRVSVRVKETGGLEITVSFL